MRFFYFLILVLYVGAANGQTHVKGTVVTEENEPLVGATVQMKGLPYGVSTDALGKFELDVPKEVKALVFMFIGMETQEIAVRPEMHVVMKYDVKQLEEVVVTVAYGKAKKSSLTGAIASVGKEKVEWRPTSNVTSVLEGIASGVQVNNTMGQPGEAPQIRIRGIGTVNGSLTPLYIVDGVPFEGEIADLNPADIESVSVLKDAASCALYGNRGANGIILITTKCGSGDKLNFEMRVNQGVYTRGVKEYRRTNPYQFMEVMWQNLKNSRMTKNKEDAATAGAYASAHLIQERLFLNIFNKADEELFTAEGRLAPGTKILPGYAGDLDWYDAATRNGYRQEYTLSGGMAAKQSDVYFSLGYLDEEGYAKNASFNRLSGRVSTNFHPKQWLKAGLNLSGTHQLTHTMKGNGSGENNYSNVFMFARQIAPIYPVHLHNPDGSYRLDENGKRQYDPGSYTNEEGKPVNTRNQYAGRHMVWENELNIDKTFRNTLHGIAYADIKFLKDFTFTLKGNLNVSNSEQQVYYNAVIGDGQGSEGIAHRTRFRIKNYTMHEQLNWKRGFDKHFLDVLFVHENYYFNYNYEYSTKNTETFAGKPFLSNFTNIGDLFGYDNNLRTESYLGRIRYNYDGKYNLEASFRRDGSSRFAKKNRWGNFGSIGANWLISDEHFMKDLTWLNSMKLRANWGQVGNDAGAGYYGYMDLFVVTQNAHTGAYYHSQNGNSDLKWETSESWGIGVEARLFDRWNLEMEYFNKHNKDLLFDVYLPLSAGSTSTKVEPEAVVTKNIGSIVNRGVEISTDADVYRSGKWRVNVSANASFIRNKVLKLPKQNKNGIVSSHTKIVEGRSRYEFFLPTFAGVDRLTGNSMYVADLESYCVRTAEGVVGNADGTDITRYVTKIGNAYYVNNTTYALKEFHGSAFPNVYGSFGLNVSYASLRLSTLFTAALGGKTYDGVYQNLMSATEAPKNLHTDIMNSWTEAPAGMTEVSADRLDPKGIPMINGSNSSYNNAVSSRWLTKSDYLVLKNISLSYSLPKHWVQRLDLQSIDINVTCENLFTLTARRGMNPQQSFDGMQYNYLVTPRVFSAGISLKL